jgi:hypothetical protein
MRSFVNERTQGIGVGSLAQTYKELEALAVQGFNSLNKCCSFLKKNQKRWLCEALVRWRMLFLEKTQTVALPGLLNSQTHMF